MRLFRWLLGPDRTIVYLRSHRSPVAHGEAIVKYDAWGTPFIPRRSFEPFPLSFGCVLHPNGRTSDTLYQIEWRHKSGPPVSFGKKPISPFPDHDVAGG
jgi:hypothetical protein